MASKKVLGRGLGAFFPDYEDTKNTENSSEEASGTYLDPKKRVNVVISVPVQNIRPNPHQPRKEFNEDRLQELADSIEEHGLIQPITVRYIGEHRFELISGERRLRATKMAGIKEVPAYVREADDDDILAFALIENIQREELNPIEVAMGYKRLIEECEFTQEQAAQKVGKNRSTVTNMMRLLNLPPSVQAALRDRSISMGHARALLAVDDPEAQDKLLNKAIDKGLSVRQVEDEIRKWKKNPSGKKSSSGQSLTTEQKALYRDISDRLRSKLSTKVAVKPKKRGGEIRIEYFSNDELDRLLELFEQLD